MTKRKPKPASRQAIPTRGKGRPTAFKTEYIATAQKLARRGFTHVEVADFFEVSDRTFRRWLYKHPELAKAMLIDDQAANDRVVLALYLTAIGFERDEEEIKVLEGKIVRVKVRKYYPPNPSALIFWTKARMKWRDNDPFDVPPDPSNDDGKQITPDGESDRQFVRRLNLLVNVKSMN